jgi:ectoine hydroxylase-related dioxygenase (phytanoyl-CoA dioxygenase family)
VIKVTHAVIFLLVRLSSFLQEGLMEDYRKRVYCSKDDITSITTSLAIFGIAVCEGFFSSEELQNIHEEYDALMNTDHGGKVENGENKVQRWSATDLENRFPTLHSIGHSPVLDKIANHFYGSNEYYFGNMYATRDRGPEVFNSFWHQDPSGVLKLLAYLCDVNQDNAAFQYNLGSHREGYYRLTSLGFYPHAGIIVPEEEVLWPVDVTGKAGTAIFFNTNGVHRAGSMQGHGLRETINFHIYGRVSGNDNFSVLHRSQARPKEPPKPPEAPQKSKLGANGNSLIRRVVRKAKRILMSRS